jgi:hypothetical protein
MVSLMSAIAAAAIGWLFLAPQGDRTGTTPDAVPQAGSSAADLGTPSDEDGTGVIATDGDNVAIRILRDAASAKERPKPERPKETPQAATVADGPWGTLQSFNVYIAAPDHVVQMFQVPSSVTAWNFFNMSVEDVVTLYDRPDIPAEIRSELTDRSRWTVTPGHIQLTPSNDLILALPPAARAAIYAVLAKWEANEFFHDPFFVPDGDVDAWLAGSGVRTDLIDVVRRTTYPAGKAFCFSDISLAVALTKSHSEARNLLKALSRSRTAILRLRLDDDSDIPRIAEYWSSGDANLKDFLPLLESVKTNPLVDHLDIIHVLPPYARKLMYTYPHPSLAIGGRYPDCHWTSLNFFSYRPEGRLFDTQGATMFVLENFRADEKPYRYGDVLFFMDPQGRAIHSCIYLADDYVFTKNGANPINPWLTMKLYEVVDRYSVNGEPTIQIYRKRR